MSHKKMRPAASIKVGITAITVCMIAVGFILIRPGNPNALEISNDRTRIKNAKRSADHKEESIFERKIRLGKADFANPEEKMDSIYEMICDDTYPSDALASKTKLHSDLEFVLSLGWSYQQLRCIDKVTTNFARDAVISATDPADYLARVSMFDEVIQEFGEKIDYEEVMNTVSGQTTTSLVLLPENQFQQYVDVMSGSLSNESGQGELASRLLGGIIAGNLQKEPSTAIENLPNIKDRSLRIGTEKALLRNPSIGADSKRIFAAYYLSEDCLLPHDDMAGKNLFGLGIKYDPVAISAIIGNAPRGPKRDLAISHLVSRNAADDPERSRLWLDAIEDPNVRTSLEKYFHEKN